MMTAHALVNIQLFMLSLKSLKFLPGMGYRSVSQMVGTGPPKPNAGSPKYLYLIFNFIIMSRFSGEQETASRFSFIN